MKKWGKWLLCGLPLGVVGMVILAENQIRELAAWLPACRFFAVTGLYCPGCGNTRAVLALCHGDFWGAIRDNASLCYLLAVILVWYVQVVCRAFGKRVAVLPKGEWFPLVSVGMCMGYWVLRNVIPALQPIFAAS